MTNQTDMKPSNLPIDIRQYEQAVYIYWLGAGLPTVKIGHTNDPDRRLAEFQRETGTPGHKARFAAIVWLDRRREAVEREAHRVLAHARRNGEWFACTPVEALGAIVQAVKSLNIRYEIEDRAGTTPEFQYNARRQDVLARREIHRGNLRARIAEARRIKHEAGRPIWMNMTCGCSVFIAGGDHPDPSSSEAIAYSLKKRFGDSFQDAWVDQVNSARRGRKLRRGNEGKLFLLAHPVPDARYYAMYDAGKTPVEAAIEVIEQCERAQLEAERIQREAAARVTADRVHREAAEQARREKEALDAAQRKSFWRRVAAVSFAIFVLWAWNQDRIESQRQYLHQFDNDRAACEKAGGGWSKAYAGMGTFCYRKR